MSLPRRSVLRTGLAAGLGVAAAALTACDTTASSAGGPSGGPSDASVPAGPRPVRHPYGRNAQQFGDLYLPDGATRGTVVVIHGGFWQSSYGLELGAGIGADLARRGWTAWNIEYRRLGSGGGWPTTYADVAAAVDHVRRLDGVDLDRVVTLGHSAGGHLAAWAASRRGSALPGGPPRVEVTATVPQAGVLDLATAAETGLGGTAVPGIVGGLPSRIPGRYRLADPLQRLPLGIPIRCMHGTSDSTVPIAQSQAYVAAARAAGDDAELVAVPGDHFALIDPGSPAWARTVEVLGELTPGDR